MGFDAFHATWHALLLKELSVLCGLSKNVLYFCDYCVLSITAHPKMHGCVGWVPMTSADLLLELLGGSGLASFVTRIPFRVFRGTPHSGPLLASVMGTVELRPARQLFAYLSPESWGGPLPPSLHS